jgi:hypothetical protein
MIVVPPPNVFLIRRHVMVLKVLELLASLATYM